ncbi:ABC transporter substrate-binding protein [Comamonas sp. lk]|uniref:ABC transporter substrate-binding protein n=1 Tax=Comamonas sp. lk TaxID=2201272 RepID=UPI000EAC876A|nr:ABC transporter substrate-binding protein [Comamonas sp. lk]
MRCQLPFLKKVFPSRLTLATGLALACALLAACSQRQETPPDQAAASVAPVTVPICGQPVSYDRVPQRAVTHGINITEMFLALGLADRLVGYGGLRDIQRLPPAMQAQLAQVPDLSNQNMNLETLLNAQPDFVFSGWSYGFRDGQITPQQLQELGIASYVLTESCIRKVARERVSLQDTFDDLLHLGRIFRIDAQAQALVNGQRAELERIAQALQGAARQPSVFLYDSGTDIPVTAGRYAMPHAMIEAAGGRNIFADLPSSWTRGNWEDVIERNPDWIVIVDNDRPTPDGKKQFLLNKPELAHLTAIRERNFVLLDFAAATPGPRNVAGVRTLAHSLHPERVAAPEPDTSLK